MVMFLVRHRMVFIFLNLFDLLGCPVMLITSKLVIYFDSKTSQTRIKIINFVRRFQTFDLVSKYNVGLKTLLLLGLSDPEFSWCLNSEE